ncbi:MAG: transporter substrate-binding domain-containing protein [Proteobacteria bacterium]|nr:transporter substrate-binding domain-containing protein [Pseudomonadota bacterium]MBU1420397.1 transporter substrate-binding domain-containing protein [Pseudomonadota bacterium]MBU1454407.1 transporter substrate-binding domain-containing protein [Pseudomonadota bacterium]
MKNPNPILRPFLLLLTASLLFLLSACTASENHSRTIKIDPDPSLLRVGVSANAPPLIYKKNGKVIGLEADLAGRLGKFTGKKVKFIDIKWENLLNALENNEIDIIMSGMTITNARKYRIAFTTPYLRSGQIMLVRLRDKALFSTGIYSLMNSNYIIGTVKDTTGDLFITQTINGAKIKSFTKSADAVKALIDKRIDAFVYDAPMICHYAAINENEKLTPILTLSTEEYLAWGIRKEDSELQAQANQFLQELNDKQELQRLIRTWIPYM